MDDNIEECVLLCSSYSAILHVQHKALHDMVTKLLNGGTNEVNNQILQEVERLQLNCHTYTKKLDNKLTELYRMYKGGET